MFPRARKVRCFFGKVTRNVLKVFGGRQRRPSAVVFSMSKPENVRDQAGTIEPLDLGLCIPSTENVSIVGFEDRLLKGICAELGELPRETNHLKFVAKTFVFLVEP